MMSFNQFIEEKFVKRIKDKSNQSEVFLNPTLKELRDVQENGQARGFLIDTGDLFVFDVNFLHWNAGDQLFKEMEKIADLDIHTYFHVIIDNHFVKTTSSSTTQKIPKEKQFLINNKFKLKNSKLQLIFQ